MLTLAIIKPDAMESRHAGEILTQLERAGFVVRAARLIRLSREQAEQFYAVHRQRPFFQSLVAFMSSGAALALALEAENAVSRLRDVIGATDPAEAKAGTIRKLYAQSKERNAIHASDSPENAVAELRFFFADELR
jgi:nucleoside-diphosphate kinase